MEGLGLRIGSKNLQHFVVAFNCDAFWYLRLHELTVFKGLLSQFGALSHSYQFGPLLNKKPSLNTE